jgi:uncharacterized protein YndB with AHSA1/START domain
MSLARTLAVAAILAFPAAAQIDPFYARVRGLTDRPYASFQGFDCTTVHAPREVVFRILASPDRAAQILLAGLPNVVPRGASYRKNAMATKGEVLTLTADTLTGSRKIEMSVVAVVPGHLLSFVVTSDPQVLAKDVTDLFDTFTLESNADGTTDVYWANHYDPSSPFMAALGPLAGRRFRVRRETGLLVLEGLGRASSEEDARAR